MENIYKNQQGLTLIELLMAVCIIGILSAVATFYGMDIYQKSFDTRAVTDAKNLTTIISENFIEDRSILYSAMNGQQMGVRNEDDSTDRSHVYTLSPGISIKWIGPEADQISSGDPDIPGNFHAFIYHQNGSPAIFNPDPNGIGKRAVEITVEEDGVFEYNTF